jgi:hypothetical protein
MKYPPRAAAVSCSGSLAAYVLALAGLAHADEVHLQGGSVIEGRASRQGDTVVVRVEAGEIRLPADSVERIQKSASSDDVAQRRRVALGARDVRGRLELAAYCRQHDLRATERALLFEVIALEPDHAEARRLLGFVKTPQGWVDRSSQLEAAREVEREAWLTRERAREREQAQADAERERALAAREDRLEAERLHEQRARDDAQRALEQAAVNAYGYGYGYAPPGVWLRSEGRGIARGPERCRDGSCQSRPPASGSQPIWINGLRYPREDRVVLPEMKDPTRNPVRR